MTNLHFLSSEPERDFLGTNKSGLLYSDTDGLVQQWYLLSIIQRVSLVHLDGYAEF